MFAVKICFSQQEANIWYFGQNLGLDFNSGTPVVLLDGALNTKEGCATISDTNGNLLFYTDGVFVYNKNHHQMPNGFDLKGDPSSTHSGIIVPKPNDPNIYYVFTVDKKGEADGLNYSEVDITADGGLGDVIVKNTPLVTPTTEKLTAIQQPDIDKYWVVTHRWMSDEFLAYEVSETGVSTSPVISAVGSFVTSSNGQAAAGAIKISPDGTKLAVVRSDGMSEVQLFDFNATTGVVSNPTTLLNLPTVDLFYGVAFSPNSKVLYISIGGNGVYQYNLEAGTSSDIINSQLLVSPTPRAYAAMQIATDGKIYIARFDNQYLDTIDNPNVIGPGCNYSFESIYLEGRLSQSGLPPFIQSFFQIDDIQFENMCFGDATTFALSDPIDSASWNFGDPASGGNNTSNLLSPMHQFSSAGTYTVTVSVVANGQSASLTAPLVIYDQPIANAVNDINKCDINNDGFYTFNLTDQNTLILNGQSSAIFDVEYFISQQAMNDNVPIPNPNAYQNLNAYQEQTIWVRVKNKNNEECSDVITFQIDVFDAPNPILPLSKLEKCDDTSFGTDVDGRIEFDLTIQNPFLLNGLSINTFPINYYRNSNLTGEIMSPESYINTNTTETIYVKVGNVLNPICEVVTSFEIEVFLLPSINTPVTIKQCDTDLDGISFFNLTQVNAELSSNSDNETISFYESEGLAEVGANPIQNPTAYMNQTASQDVVWARVENDNDCFRVAQVNLLVSTTQLPLSFFRELYECDDVDSGSSTDGIATFDLTGVNAEILALIPSGQQLELSYYENEIDALTEINPLIDLGNHSNMNSPFSQDIFIRIESSLDNECERVAHHITLNVENIPVAHSVQITPLCDPDGDGVEAFDTSSIEASLLQGQNGMQITYTDQNGVVLSSPLPNPFETGDLNVTATVSLANSQDPDGRCESETIMTFVVDKAAFAFPVPIQQSCDDDFDGIESFDTTDIQSTVLGGQVGMDVFYFDENGNTLSSPLPNPYIIASQVITARVENPMSDECFEETEIVFEVSKHPVANGVDDYILCDDLSNDGEEIFELNLFDEQVLGDNQTTADFSVFYFASAEDAQMNQDVLGLQHVNNNPRQTIYARIHNNTNTSCFAATSFDIGVDLQPLANTPLDIIVCDDISNDRIALFDLSEQDEQILDLQSDSDYRIIYYATEEDAILSQNSLPIEYENVRNPQTIYARIENKNNPSCFDITEFQLKIERTPVIVMDDQWYICNETSVVVTAPQGFDSYEWSTGEMSQEIELFETGIYELKVTYEYETITCDDTFSFTVENSSAPQIIDVEIRDWTQKKNVVTVSVSGTGDYEYSIDGEFWQDSPILENVKSGERIVFVRDKNGCGVALKKIYVLYYPHFFTPNNDGINDYWNIIGSKNEPSNLIRIFDRYGKFLIRIDPLGNGWDGTYQGRPLPKTDYWFSLDREGGVRYTGHFSLIR